MTFYIFVPKMHRVPLQHRLTKTRQSFVLELKKHKKAKCFNFIINQNCSRVESNWVGPLSRQTKGSGGMKTLRKSTKTLLKVI